MKDSTPRYDVAIFTLKHWGREFKRSSKLEDIGYPKQCSFMNDPTGAGYHSDIEPDDNVIHVDKVLRKQPILYLVAQCSFAFHAKESIATKSNLLHVRGGVWLGSTSNSQRVMYKALETQLVAYIDGAFAAMDEET